MSSEAAIHVSETPERAAVLLHPLRGAILRSLVAPGSAADVAGRLDLPRQKVNYHVRELEREGFVRLVEERRKGNCIERIVQATATAYLIDPDILRTLGEQEGGPSDRFSSAYLIATAARTLRDVAILRERAAEAKQTLPTLSLQADVRFASAKDRGEFAERLARCFAELVAEYHDDHAPRGRVYRVTTASYPAITNNEQTEDTDHG